MTTDPRLLETLRRLATKGNSDTMPISLCPEGAALERIEQLDAENERLRTALEPFKGLHDRTWSDLFDAINAGSSAAFSQTWVRKLSGLRVALTAGDRDE